MAGRQAVQGTSNVGRAILLGHGDNRPLGADAGEGGARPESDAMEKWRASGIEHNNGGIGYDGITKIDSGFGV